MNYSQLLKNFGREVASKIQYKHIGSPFKVFAAIATIPFWIAYAFMFCAQYVYLFTYNAVASCVDYLEAWVKDTKKSVNQLTEAVIYLVTTPVIFGIRCFLSLFSIGFYFMWFFTMCYAYIATLGGIRWQPFISNAKFGPSIKSTPTTKKGAGAAISIIGFSLVVLAIFIAILGAMIGASANGSFNYNDVNAYQRYLSLIAVSTALTSFSGILFYGYFLFMIIAVPVGFKKVVTGADDEQAAPEAQTADSAEEFPEF